MRSSDWSLIILITICVAFLSNLFSSVICVHLHDLMKDGPATKSPYISEKLVDDIEDQLNTDLIPPNFQPDPLLPIGSDDDNFEDIGQLNKERQNYDDDDDPFSLYIGNVFNSLPEASDIFDVLRLNDELDNLSDSTELIIPILVNSDDEGDDEESRNGPSLRSDTTLKLAKILLDSKHLNKSDKSGNKDHGKLVGKLNPIGLTTTLSFEDTSENLSESKEGIAIDEIDDEDESMKSTTKSSKFRHFDNPLYKWWSTSKSTIPKADQKSRTKTTTYSTETTTEKPNDDEDDDEDFILSSIENSTVSHTTHSSIHGKGKSTATTIKESKSNKSSTISPTTHDQSATSESESQKLTTTDKPSTLTTKHSKSTTSQTSKITKNNKKDSDEDEDDELMEDPIDTFLITLNPKDESNDDDEDDEKVTESTFTSTSTPKSEGKHSHKHNKTTTAVPTSSETPTTPDEIDESSDDPDNKLSTKSTPSGSTTKETSTESPTTDLNSDDSFPILSVTRSKSKSDESTTTISTSTTPTPSLTTHGRKTTRHSSTTETTSKSTSSTPIPALHPYVEDPDDDDDDDDDVYLPIWNPDIFP